MEYIIYCDESSSKGEKFTDFYGGCIVDGRYVNQIISELENRKLALNLNNEIKWVKVTENYLEKYISVIDTFFGYVKEGKIKVRIMFRRKEKQVNYFNSAEDKYFKLYYQFLKHSFGLRYIPANKSATVRFYLDKLPDRIEKCNRFKDFLYNMPNTQFFSNSGLRIAKEDIIEIDSKKHVIQQCVDIILGSMYFRLNELHKVIPEGKKRRGSRTVAKDKLYAHIRRNIDGILPNFNIGISTGKRHYVHPHWESPYEHWLFSSYEITELENNQNKEQNS